MLPGRDIRPGNMRTWAPPGAGHPAMAAVTG